MNYLEIIRCTIEGTEHLGDNLKKACLDYLDNLQQENQRLRIQISAREEEYRKMKDNWNELKNNIKQDIKQSEQLIEECPRELRNTIVGTRSYETIVEYNKYILSKMQELEGKGE